MQIYFHSCLCSYLSRVPILVEGTVYCYGIVTLKIPITYFIFIVYCQNTCRLGWGGGVVRLYRAGCNGLKCFWHCGVHRSLLKLP